MIYFYMAPVFLITMLTVTSPDAYAPGTGKNFLLTGSSSHAITLGNAPEIVVRPLSLDFTKPQPPALVGELSASAAAISRREHTKFIAPALLKIAEKRGFVRIIVGLESTSQPDGLQGANAQTVKRKKILDAGNRLMASLGNYTANIRHQYQSIPYLAMRVDRQALELLQRSPLVNSIEEDTLNEPFLASSNQVIGSPIAWAEAYDGSGWAVAVLDTGVETSHSWFTTGRNKIVSEACYSTSDPGLSESWCPDGAPSSTAVNSGVNCAANIPGCDHGTHVAGIVAGNDGNGPNYGVARGADIIAIQVFSKFLTVDDCGAGRAPCLLSLDSDLIAAMERVLLLSESMNIAAVNLSLGGDDYFDQSSCDEANPSSKAAIQNLRDAGIATVVASGNSGATDAISAPGCISNAISVGATDDTDKVAYFTNIYPQLHLLAPGVAINSSIPVNNVGSKQGTSMATPQVAGAWAVMKQRMPLASVTEVLDAFTSTGTQVIDQRSPPDPVQTFPRINLDMALGEPRTTFAIYNDGTGTLNVDSITSEPPAPWIGVVPLPPYTIEAGEMQVVSVLVDYPDTPEGDSQVRLLVNSDDKDENPYPAGVFVNIKMPPDPAPGYHSTPAANSTIDFGSVIVGNTSNGKTVNVVNTGNVNLTISCNISGTHNAEFRVDTCASPITPARNAFITLFCDPATTGLKTATLQVTTNDADEGQLSYPLNCTGIEAPVIDEIFKNGFEG